MVLGCSRHYRSGVLEGLSYTVLVDSSLNSEGPFCKGAVLFWGSKKVTLIQRITHVFRLGALQNEAALN